MGEPEAVPADDGRKDQVFRTLGHALELVGDGQEPLQLDVVLHPAVILSMEENTFKM